MKLKLTLASPGQDDRDLVATVDSSTTIGELATHLASADPRQLATHLASADPRQPVVPIGTKPAVAPQNPGKPVAPIGTRPPRAPADPEPPEVPGPGEHDVTLAVLDPFHHELDAHSTVPESGLRSGVTVSVIRRSEASVDVGRPAAVAVVVEGPDVGMEVALSPGTAYIGRSHGCEVQVSDSSVSRRHAKLLIGELPAVPEVVDLGSANGISVGGAEVARAVLKTGDRVRLGDTEVEVRLLENASGSAGSDCVAFSRSPRLAPFFKGREHDLPCLPERPRPSRMPWLAMLFPALLGIGMFAFTRSPYSLIFVVMSPMMMLGNQIEQRRGGKKEFASLMQEFRQDLEVVTARICESLEAEADQRRRENPSGAECAQAARRLSPLLWTRRDDTPGFLQLRLGRGTLPSRSSMRMPPMGRSTAQAWLELAAAVDGLSVVPGVPVVIDPLSTGAIGLSGHRDVVLPAARSLVLQAVSLHSPAELIVTAFASTTSAHDWDWLKWVPHTASAHSPISVGHLASAAPACAALLSELEDLIARALEPTEPKENPNSRLPRILVLVENDAPAERGRLVQLAEKGWRKGVCVLWLAPTTAQLPAACRVFLEVEGSAVTASSEGRVGNVNEGTLVTPIAVDTLSLQETLAAARSLSPVEDSGAPRDDDSDLPSAVSLLSLIGTDLARSEHAVIERWGESRSILAGPFAPENPCRRPGNLRAILGRSAQGTFSVDLRADGPHALVGGTTGAGKSELLQAWILGMATAHSPQRVTFLLVDYKGGSAFRSCVDLPHTVGLVTDLSPHLVRRALASLSAELRYREHLLALHNAKDLVELERRGEVDAPPSLVIVVDEFAALVQEVPEFVDGVVNVAQRGRSFGLHLILATQRPSGVIKDNLRANTNLRMALRMADENDSADVLGSGIAASFDPAMPGRAVSRGGPGRLTPFQAGYAGGWTSDTPPPPQIRVETLTYGLSQVWEPPVEQSDVEDARRNVGPTDIQRLVSTIGLAARTAELPTPRVPWLPELRPVYDLADLPTAGRDDQLVFGVADDPENQAQPVVAFNPDREGNLAVFGASGSGKSAFLRTIALAAGSTMGGGPCHVYGIDFGNRALSMLESLPHVGSIVAGADHERLTRLLLFLRETIDDRAVRYSSARAATITDFRALADAPDEPRIIVLLDGLTAFRQAYETGGRARWLDLFTSLAADGRPVGVHFVISVDQRTGMPASLAAAIQRRVVLRMAHPDDYGFLGVAGDVLSMASPPGRGLLNGAEIQCAVLGGTAEVMTQSRAVSAFGDALRKADAREPSNGGSPDTPGSNTREPSNGGSPDTPGSNARQSRSREAPPIRSLTDRVLMEELPTAIDGRPVLGIASTGLSALPFEPRGSFVVTGPSGSGRTTSLASLALSLHRWEPAMALFFLTPRRCSELSSLVDWAEVATGPDAITTLASRLLAELHTNQPGGQHDEQRVPHGRRFDEQRVPHGRQFDELRDRNGRQHDKGSNGTRQRPIVAVIIERVDDLAGTAAESAVSSLVKACLDDGQFVVAEGEVSFFSSNFGLPGLLKTSRSGLALQPDGIEGQTVFRSSFPAINRADLPEGRGFLVERGRPELLQVALP